MTVAPAAAAISWVVSIQALLEGLAHESHEHT
jgi:hypothetical protein